MHEKFEAFFLKLRGFLSLGTKGMYNVMETTSHTTFGDLRYC